MLTIDGNKFLAIMGLPNDNTLTAEMVAEKLASLSEEERANLAQAVTIAVENKPVLDINALLQQEPVEYVAYKDDLDRLSDVEIRRKLKYEKNYMAASAMKRQLGPRNYGRGKHAKGKKFVKK